MSFDSIRAILDSGRFAELVGLDEDTWLEAKGRNPYDLNSPGGRYELAKDVSAFANADGGFLIVGLTTQVLLETKAERITGQDLCTQAEFEVGRYLGVIKENVHPEIKNLEIYWLPVGAAGTHGLGVVEVPPQSPNHKYFLIASVVEAGAALKQIVFGIAKRNESSNDPFTIAELYKYTQSGKHPVPQTLARLEEKIERLLQMQGRSPVAAADPERVYAERATRILKQDSV